MSTYAELRGRRTEKWKIEADTVLVWADWYDPSAGVFFSDDDGKTWRQCPAISQVAATDGSRDAIRTFAMCGEDIDADYEPHLTFVGEVGSSDSGPDRR
jgi:hypothetical protein